jgi:hypothetical protein
VVGIAGRSGMNAQTLRRWVCQAEAVPARFCRAGVQVVAKGALLKMQGSGCRGSHFTSQIRDRWTASRMN